jgi:hypothetical protein
MISRKAKPFLKDHLTWYFQTRLSRAWNLLSRKRLLMHRDYRLYLDDILDAIDRIRDYVEGMDDDAFISDRKTQDAVIRNLEVIGEGLMVENASSVSIFEI